jgi:hypothetical protein
MTTHQKLLAITVLALTLAFSVNNALAQNGGGGGGGTGGGMAGMMRDPAQRAQMQVDSLRDTLAVPNDDEWNAISPRLLKVVQIKSEITMAEMVRMMAPMMAKMGRGGRPNPFGGQPDPSADALQKALEDKASGAGVKAALAKFREAKKQKQAELARAQDSLKEILSIRQEAALAMAGYLE